MTLNIIYPWDTLYTSVSPCLSIRLLVSLNCSDESIDYAMLPVELLEEFNLFVCYLSSFFTKVKSKTLITEQNMV